MKVLFLDLDGVVNTHRTPVRTELDPTNKDLTVMICSDPEKVFMLNKLVDRHDFKVVLSSSWRADPNWRTVMKANGFVFPFLDRTPDNRGLSSRGSEIRTWIGSWNLHNPDNRVEKYAIIDDNADMLEEQMPNFFKTSWGVGLTDEIAEQVITHLNS